MRAAWMRAAWTAFAVNGDPGWPPYDTTRHRTRIFDTSSPVTTYPEDRSRLLWQDHRFPPLTLGGDRP